MLSRMEYSLFFGQTNADQSGLYRKGPTAYLREILPGNELGDVLEYSLGFETILREVPSGVSTLEFNDQSSNRSIANFREFYVYLFD